MKTIIYSVITVAAFALILIINPFRADNGTSSMSGTGDVIVEAAPEEAPEIAELRDALSVGKASVLIPGGAYDLLTPLEVLSDVSLQSSNNMPITLKVSGDYRHVIVSGKANAQFFNTVFEGPGELGGGLETSADGSLMLVNCIVKNCEAEIGGGINANLVTLAESEIMDNYARDGGGIYAKSLKASRCAIINNTAERCGGGIYALSGSVLENCTIYGNSSSEDGGGVFFSKTSSMTHCTVSGNRAKNGGGAALAKKAALNAVATLIVGNEQDGENEVQCDSNAVKSVSSIVGKDYPLDEIFVLDSDGNPILRPVFNTYVIDIVKDGVASDKVDEIYSVADQIGNRRPNGDFSDIGAAESK